MASKEIRSISDCFELINKQHSANGAVCKGECRKEAVCPYGMEKIFEIVNSTIITGLPFTNKSGRVFYPVFLSSDDKIHAVNFDMFSGDVQFTEYKQEFEPSTREVIDLNLNRS